VLDLRAVKSWGGDPAVENVPVTAQEKDTASTETEKISSTENQNNTNNSSQPE
jgi:hypothetical protein